MGVQTTVHGIKKKAESMSNDTEVEENNDNDDIGENVMANTTWFQMQH